MKNRIAIMRKARGLTQQDLADRAGAHIVTVSKLERGEMKLTTDWIVTLAAALHCKTSEIWSGEIDGWQPIETAPKDGQKLILFTAWEGDMVCDKFEAIQIGQWTEGNGLDPEDDFFRESGWDCQFIGNPTHWMPLPAPPIAPGKKCETT